MADGESDAGLNPDGEQSQQTETTETTSQPPPDTGAAAGDLIAQLAQAVAQHQPDTSETQTETPETPPADPFADLGRALVGRLTQNAEAATSTAGAGGDDTASGLNLLDQLAETAWHSPGGVRESQQLSAADGPSLNSMTADQIYDWSREQLKVDTDNRFLP